MDRPHPPGAGFPASIYPYLLGASPGQVQETGVPRTDHRHASSDDDQYTLEPQQNDNSTFKKRSQHLSTYFDYCCSLSEHDGNIRASHGISHQSHSNVSRLVCVHEVNESSRWTKHNVGYGGKHGYSR